MVPTTAALAEPEPLIMPIALEPTHRGLRNELPRAAGDHAHHVDHRALRLEAVGDAGEQQEGGDQA